MQIYKKRTKKKNTQLFFDSFKHFKHNLSNLIGIELPTLLKLGAKNYFELISTNYKSKYPDMRKIGLIEYDKPRDYSFDITPEAKVFVDNPALIQNIYSKNDLKEGRKNIDSLQPESLIKCFTEPDNNISQIYCYETLKLILSYYDTADCIRPYLALLNFMRHHNMKILDKDLLQNILAQTKEDILLMRFNADAFNMLDNETQKELKRPISYIYNFLQTALVLDSSSKIVIDYALVDRFTLEMENIVLYQSNIERNLRPAREQRNFRQNVLKAYNYKCAITAKSIFVDDRCLLEAAHIIPYRDGGSFAISNGIALSYEMHKMFDNGLFGFVYENADSVKIQVSKSKKIVDNERILDGIKDRKILLPKNEEYYPDNLALEYNLQKYLLK